MAKKLRMNSFLFCCALLGALPVGLILLALLNITLGQLSDPEFLWLVATESEVVGTILLTFFAGLCAVIILLIVGTPLAYLLARSATKTAKVIGTIIDLPVMLPHTIAGILVYLLFMPNGWLGAPFSAIGITFQDAFFGIVAAMLFVATPFYVTTVQEGFG
ncbi:MAG: molybdenum ABC transporter permease, partial [Methanocorpusculum sp.]|nr:molybdenum ABC transporter permease [Methanocorpusculum sp.]